MSAEKQDFFRDNAELAMEEQIRYGIPASVTLIQMWFESGGGKSDVAREANNYFGIKDHAGARRGDIVYRHDDADEKNAPFKVFKSKEDSIRGHSLFLMRDNYKSCHGLSSTDYEGWLKGLKRCGYASAAGYDTKLIEDLEHYNLQQYDQMAEKKATEMGVRCGYMRGAKDHGVRTSSADMRVASSQSLHFGMPLRYDGGDMVMTSDFGPRNISEGSHNHRGIDLRAAKGTDVFATEDNGIVISRNYQGRLGNGKAGGGNYIYVAYPRPDGSYRVTGYLHLDTVNVKVGDRVNASTVLGKSGNSGCTAPHLHFEAVEVKGKDAEKLTQEIREKCLKSGESLSTAFKGSKKENVIDPKLYLAEVAVQGNVDTRIIASDNQDVDILAKFKEKVTVAPKDEVLYAENQQKQESGSLEGKFSKQAASNPLLSALLGNDSSGLSQMFEGGRDLTSSIINMLMMSFLTLAFNQKDKEEQSQQKSAEKEQKPERKEYEVFESKIDAKAMAEMASTQYDIGSEQLGREQVSQQERSGYSV